MRKWLWVILLILIESGITLYANCYWIGLRDKQGSAGDLLHPEQLLSERALQRRQRQNIKIDSLDLPVSKVYVDSIRKAGAEILHCSRWQNGVTIQVKEAGITDLLNSYDFITCIELTEDTLYENKALPFPTPKKTVLSSDSIDYGSATSQVDMLHLDKLHAEGYQGEDILIALADDGFYNVPSIEGLRGAYERTIYTHDFVTYGGDVYLQGTHGTMVLSTIGAETEMMAGTAPKAKFVLMRTEDDDYENYREMDNLCAAFELADSIGADIISISLGYFDAFDSPDMTLNYSQLDGRTTRCARSATIAARKGMIVCAAAGNEGNKDWHYICTPSDADSILCVGAVTSEQEHSSFSSVGPSADGRVKPELCAQGSNCGIIDAQTGNVRTGNGTSFATPIMAGAVACLWGALPDKSNMEIISLLIEHSSQHGTPDYVSGYGIPDVWAAYKNQQTSLTKLNNSLLREEVRIYNLNGLYMGTELTHLPHGVYLLRSGESVYKAVR